MKICSRCKIEKPYSEYHKGSNVGIGIKSHCKVCDSKAAKARWQKDKAKKAKQKTIIGYHSSLEWGDTARIWEERCRYEPSPFTKTNEL